jgi:uncharacterized zinc-type alcohol dehydrogenase-like protein
MITVRSRATAGVGEPFRPWLIERRDPGPHDVVIDIAYAGICHTDISHARSEWSPTIFPLVPGHEIVGVVSQAGADVFRFSPGDRAGVGVMVDSCRRCPACRAGKEQHCAGKFTRTYNWVGRDGKPTYGGYSEKIVVDEAFAVSVPESLPLTGAAPLLCAGITVYSPLRRWGAGPGRRVAILGLGGLGHVGVQVAHALGAHTTALGLLPDSEKDALGFGADEYRITTDPATFGELAGSFDLILSTVPASIDLDAYCGLLAVEGTLVNIGASDQHLAVSPFTLMTNSRSIAGSSIGGIAETQEMLDFCAVHGITAQVEIIDADGIDVAYERIGSGDVRYRFVIDISTIARKDPS